MAVTPPLPLTHFEMPDYEELFEFGEPEPESLQFTANNMYVYDASAGQYVQNALPF